MRRALISAVALFIAVPAAAQDAPQTTPCRAAPCRIAFDWGGESAASHGPRSASPSATPARMSVTFSGGWYASPSWYGQPSDSASRRPTVVFPAPAGPITTITIVRHSSRVRAASSALRAPPSALRAPPSALTAGL